jgi:hypothetical protein
MLDNAQNYPARQCPWLYTSDIMIVVPSHSCIPECCHISFLFLSGPVPPLSVHVWTLSGPLNSLQVPVCSTSTCGTHPSQVLLKVQGWANGPLSYPSKPLKGTAHCFQESVPSSSLSPHALVFSLFPHLSPLILPSGEMRPLSVLTGGYLRVFFLTEVPLLPSVQINS